MKKLLSIALSLMMIVTLFSCSTDSADDSDSESNTEETAPEYAVDPAEVFDFIVEKEPGEEFTILVMSDTQMGSWWWKDKESQERNNQRYTVEELVKVTEPDLILHTGDFCADGETYIVQTFGNYIDKFGIPWAPVLGNHDPKTERGLEIVTEEFALLKNVMFKLGDPELGAGNYTIGIRENGKFVEGIFMMSKNTSQLYVNENGTEFYAEASLNEAQQKWYREKVEMMKQIGCNESMIVTHMPLRGHVDAFNNAIEDLSVYYSLLTPDSAKDGAGWKEEYMDTSFGITPVTCADPNNIGHIHPDDGSHDLFKELGHTKNAICGHCHENNASVVYDGIRYTHGLKTGQAANSYWTYDFGLNGGTVFKLGSEGVTDIYHEYIPIGDSFDKVNCHGAMRAPFDTENQ